MVQTDDIAIIFIHITPYIYIYIYIYTYISYTHIYIYHIYSHYILKGSLQYVESLNMHCRSRTPEHG